MDSSAIKLIQDTAVDARRNFLPYQIQEHVVALPDNYKLLTIEQYLPHRLRFRGRLKTSSIPDFVTYVKNNPFGEGFIDSDDLSAKVFFNLGSKDHPGHADWTARLELTKTVEFSKLLFINGNELGQKSIIDFIEDWSPYLGAFQLTSDGERTDIPIPKVIAAIRKVKIEEKSSTEVTQGNYKAETSRLDSVEATSDEGLPDFMTFSAAPYLGLSPRVFKLRLSVLSSNSKPMFKFRILGLEKQKEEIALEFKELISKEIGSAAHMVLGEFSA